MANSGGVYTWSRTGATNSSADTTVNWAEGQPPSSVNDSARNMMASTAKYRDDIAGAIVTTGTSSAYIVGSYQVFDNLTDMGGNLIAFTPHATNAGTCTLNVDSLGAKPLRSALGVEIPAGTIIQGTPYMALYNAADGAFYLHGLFGNPYSIPLGATIDYWLPTAPNSSFVFPFGQAISRTTYATLFAVMGTTYGVGNGSTTFNLPDLRGRTLASPDNMGGSDAARLAGGGALATVRFSLGGAGGEDGHPLIVGEIPTLTSSGTNSISVSGSTGTIDIGSGIAGVGAGGNNIGTVTASGSVIVSSTGNNTISVTSQNTGGSGGGTASPHNNMQPTILCNRIMRII